MQLVYKLVKSNNSKKQLVSFRVITNCYAKRLLISTYIRCHHSNVKTLIVVLFARVHVLLYKQLSTSQYKINIGEYLLKTKDIFWQFIYCTVYIYKRLWQSSKSQNNTVSKVIKATCNIYKTFCNIHNSKVYIFVFLRAK